MDGVVNKIPVSEVFLEDCMVGMKRYEDGYFDLAIVDAPYGDSVIAGGYMTNCATGVARVKNYNLKVWEQKAPDQNYFDELFRVSKNQIIWGANHFGNMKPSSCWIVWDKLNTGDYADCELAWTSFNTAVRKFPFMWNGMLQGDMKNKEIRIHPTQKPVALYKWLLENYAHEGDRILDTHLGSGSSRIAAYDMGFHFTGFEIDADYYAAQEKRFQLYMQQPKLPFTKQESISEQQPLF